MTEELNYQVTDATFNPLNILYICTYIYIVKSYRVFRQNEYREDIRVTVIADSSQIN